MNLRARILPACGDPHEIRTVSKSKSGRSRAEFDFVGITTIRDRSSRSGRSFVDRFVWLFDPSTISVGVPAHLLTRTDGPGMLNGTRQR